MDQAIPGGAAPSEPKDQFSDLVANISDGMAMLTEVMGSVNPDSAAELTSIADQFKSAVEKAMSGASSGAKPASGLAPQQAGAGKAIPASPAGIPRG